MGQREPDGSEGPEIVDEGYVRLPEFTAVISPACWSKARQHGREFTALVVETHRPGSESCILPHLRQVSFQSHSAAGSLFPVCTWAREKHHPCKFPGKTGIRHLAL